MELLNEAYGWLSGLSPLAVYAALFAVAYIENIVPPIPGDVALVVGGMVAAAGAVSAPVVVALATLAGGLGFMSVYVAGRRLGRALLDPDRFKGLPKADLLRAEARVAKHGVAVVALNRFMPGLRSVIGLAVGMSGLPSVRVAALSTLSAGVWSALVVGAGYALVDNREALARLLGGFERVGTVLLVALAAGLVVAFVRARQRRARAVP